MTDPNHVDEQVAKPAAGSSATHDQPEPEASSDGDGSWADDPQTQDPDEDRSVDAVIRRTAHTD